MKEFRLSTSADRVTGISIAAATIVCLGLLVSSLRDQLGIEFVDTVPLWEYDEEAGKQHRKEVAEQQKREVKERRKARMEQFTKNFKK